MKVVKIIERANGSRVKIVAELFISISGIKSISNYVLSAQSPSSDWVLHTENSIQRPFNGVNDYLTNGRPKMLNVASIGEILKVNQEVLMLAN